jgi:hypothetical protein
MVAYMKDPAGEIFHKTSSAPRISAYVQDDRDGLWRVFPAALLHIPQTGLDLLGARYYNPHLGRFLPKDPIEGGSANAYEYAGGDPINKVDPEGTYFFGVGLAYYYYLAYLLSCLFQGCPTARDIPAPFGSQSTVRYYPKRNSSTPTPAPARFGAPSGFRQADVSWSGTGMRGLLRLPPDNSGWFSWQEVGFTFATNALTPTGATTFAYFEEWTSEDPEKTSWLDFMDFAGATGAAVVCGRGGGISISLCGVGIGAFAAGVNALGQLSIKLW